MKTSRSGTKRRTSTPKQRNAVNGLDAEGGSVGRSSLGSKFSVNHGVMSMFSKSGIARDEATSRASQKKMEKDFVHLKSSADPGASSSSSSTCAPALPSRVREENNTAGSDSQNERKQKRKTKPKRRASTSLAKVGSAAFQTRLRHDVEPLTMVTRSRSSQQLPQQQEAQQPQQQEVSLPSDNFVQANSSSLSSSSARAPSRNDMLKNNTRRDSTTRGLKSYSENGGASNGRAGANGFGITSNGHHNGAPRDDQPPGSSLEASLNGPSFEFHESEDENEAGDTTPANGALDS
jgi:hypothetical protein